MTDRDDLELAQRLAHDAMPVLTIQTSQGIYPYMITDGVQMDVERPSMSTNSMICYAIAAVMGLLPRSVATASCRRVGRPGPIDASLRLCLERSLATMVPEIARRGESPDRPQVAAGATDIFKSESRPEAGPFDSGTFGIEDPFTLLWLVELLGLAASEPLLADSAVVDVALLSAQTTATRRVTGALANPMVPVLKSARPEEHEVLHPLPLIRIIQLARLLSIGDERQFAKISSWFFDRLHMQLSLKGIEHGGFDPAELIFALEGIVETAPLRATLPIIKRFVSCLDEAGRLDPTFRAITPFKATQYGSVHDFSSIEAFASLLRIASNQEVAGNSRFFEQIKPILRDYVLWLQASVVTGQLAPPTEASKGLYPPEMPLQFVGWQSEYTHTGDPSVHVWLTSQVILFLRAYEVLLQRNIARAELVTVGLASVPPGDNRLSMSERTAQARRDDPLQLGDGSPYRVASRLEASFVIPRLDNKLRDLSYSCLLYGPPGTGKTTLARGVAAGLGWPLVTITTSDFIVDGDAQVEARAKRIFESLADQREIVVFFDEIDRLVLDRDTIDYKNQGDMLQFMTPSMLTKINDLRQSEFVIFIVATNYADRIDRAIKRAGRIDERLLVLPPDLARREEIIKDAVSGLPGSLSEDAEVIRGAAIAGYWRTIAEIKAAVRGAARNGGNLTDAVTAVVPAISLESYISRLDAFPIQDGPPAPPELLEEAFLLTYLLMQGREEEPLPRKYDALASRWVGRAEGIVRDGTVESALDRVFSRAR